MVNENSLYLSSSLSKFTLGIAEVNDSDDSIGILLSEIQVYMN